MKLPTLKNAPMAFILMHAVLGGLAGVVTVAAIVLTDTAHVGSLVRASEDGALALAIMGGFFAITFGSVQVAIGLYLGLADGEDD